MKVNETKTSRRAEEVESGSSRIGDLNPSLSYFHSGKFLAIAILLTVLTLASIVLFFVVQFDGIVNVEKDVNESLNEISQDVSTVDYFQGFASLFMILAFAGSACHSWNLYTNRNLYNVDSLRKLGGMTTYIRIALFAEALSAGVLYMFYWWSCFHLPMRLTSIGKGIGTGFIDSALYLPGFLIFISFIFFWIYSMRAEKKNYNSGANEKVKRGKMGLLITAGAQVVYSVVGLVLSGVLLPFYKELAAFESFNEELKTNHKFILNFWNSGNSLKAFFTVGLLLAFAAIALVLMPYIQTIFDDKAFSIDGEPSNYAMSRTERKLTLGFMIFGGAMIAVAGAMLPSMWKKLRVVQYGSVLATHAGPALAIWMIEVGLFILILGLAVLGFAGVKADAPVIPTASNEETTPEA